MHNETGQLIKLLSDACIFRWALTTKEQTPNGGSADMHRSQNSQWVKTFRYIHSIHSAKNFKTYILIWVRLNFFYFLNTFNFIIGQPALQAISLKRHLRHAMMYKPLKEPFNLTAARERARWESRGVPSPARRLKTAALQQPNSTTLKITEINVFRKGLPRLFSLLIGSAKTISGTPPVRTDSKSHRDRALCSCDVICGHNRHAKCSQP